MAEQAVSPMMQQYLEIKNQHKDEILFYRIGDFYEMFFDDAVTASRELDLTLTGKQCGLAERAPMCGVPFHSYEGYVARLIAKGYKVAICEQLEDPALAKGIVKRDVIRVVTPGTVIESSGSMDELARQLADYPGFLRPHRSYLVNMEYIQNITAKSITMESLAEVPLPHGRFTAVRDQYLEYAFAGKKVVL